MPGSPSKGSRGGSGAQGGRSDRIPPPSPDAHGSRVMMLVVDYKVVRIAEPGGWGADGRARAAKYGVLAIARSDGLIIFLSKAQRGLATGAASLRAILPKLGILTDLLENPDTPPDERVVVCADRALQEIKKVWPGADVLVPHGGRRAAGAARAADIAKSMQSAESRSGIEMAFRGIDGCKLVGSTFVGTVDDFDETLHVVSGMVNMQVMMRAKESRKKGSGKKGSGRKNRKGAGMATPRGGDAAGRQG